MSLFALRTTKGFKIMNYPWFEEICKTDTVTQGDIVVNCPIPLPSGELFDAILDDKEECEESIELKNANVILLSQACDISNEKIDSLIVCPIWPLETLKASNSYYKSSKARESLRQGKEPSYHLLNKYSSENIKHEYSVVDFHRIYSLPKQYIKKIAKSIDIRLRLLPPYREHLSQAFARYFMRVGLPIDIDKDAIKKI